MKKLLLFLFACSLFTNGYAQNDFRTIVIEDHIIKSPADTFHIDLDKDGDIDIIGSAIGSDSFLWFENDGNGNFKTNIINNSEIFSDGAHKVSAADMDNDGDIDVIGTTRNSSSKLIWFQNDGNFNFTFFEIDSFISTSNSIVAIKVVDLNNDGNMDILTANTNSFNYYMNSGDGTFAKLIINDDPNYAKQAGDVGSIDMDNDGDLDVIGTLIRPAKYLWFENDGNENFTPHVIEDTYLLIDGALSIDAGDVDNDGDIDLVGASANARRYLWFENDGNQNFTTKEIEYDDQYADNANKVKLWDMDNDGDLDVLGSSNHSISTGLYWFENDAAAYPANRFRAFGDNSSVKIISHGGGVSSTPNKIINVADFDGDGDPDISAISNNSFHWFKNEGTSLKFSQNLIGDSFVANGAKEIHSGDLDGDGDIDFVGLSSFNQISWFENLGNENFKTHIKLDDSFVYGNPKWIELKDFDNDGDIDIVGAGSVKYPDNKYNEAYFWFKNDGNANFQYNFINAPEEPIKTASYFATSDFDNDGDSDLIGLSTYKSYKIYLYRNDGNNSFTSELILDVSKNYRSAKKISKVDLDSDGNIDILVQVDSNNENDLLWLKNDGSGNFEINEIVLPDRISEINSIVSMDMDNDGDVDLITSSWNDSERLGWHENDGNENFIFHIINANIKVDYFDVLDIDNDSDYDITVAHYQTGFTLIRNDGGGVFTTSVIDNSSRNSNGATFVGHTDFNGDGATDLITASGNSGDAFLLYLNEGIKNEIYGKINLDIDANGCDIQDLSLRNIMVTAENGLESKTTFTDFNGLYKVLVGTGNYTTTLSSNIPTYFSPTPNSQISTFGTVGNSENINFCFGANQPVNDLSITVIPTSLIKPGFGALYELVYKNTGTTDFSGSISFEYDDRLSFYYSSETSTSNSGNVLSFDFIDIKPFESRKINLAFTVPFLNNINLGDILEFTAIINPIVGDYTEDNNVFHLEQTVTGSFDPNDITCLEGEKVKIEDAGDYLNYVIRFQNTGTAAAIKVKVDHELDADLDWETFTPISSSHTNTTTITNGKDVEFLFENINLSDSTSDEPASHGYVAFKIKPKSGIEIGDNIQGAASIFFDFNPPIITNTVNTEFVQSNQPLISNIAVVKPISCLDEGAIIQVIASGGTKPYQYELWDQNNNKLRDAQASNYFNILNAGNYIIRVFDYEGEAVENNFSIQDPSPVEITVVVTDVSVNGANDGRIEVNVNEGRFPYEYSINAGNLTNNNIFSNLPPGPYSITVVDANDCESTNNVVISEPEILSTSNNVIDSGLYIYPNPVELGDIIVILEDNSINVIQLFLYSSEGRKVLNKTFKVVNNGIKINTDGLSSGIYTLKIETSYKTYTKKIIKK